MNTVSSVRLNYSVAVIDSDDDTRSTLAEFLTHAGYSVVSCSLADVQFGTVNWLEFIAEQEPDVLVWDLPYPYQRTAAFLRLMCTSTTVVERPFVVTSTNAPTIKKVLGGYPSDHVVAIVAKPYQPLQLIDAVETAVAWRQRRLAEGTAIRKPHED